MTEISVLDLQNLRHLIGGFDTTHCKMQDYAHEAQDPQVKQFFQKSAQSAISPVCVGEQAAAHAVFTVGGGKDDR